MSGPSVWGSNAGIIGALHLAVFSLSPTAVSPPPPPPPPSPPLEPPNPRAVTWPSALHIPADQAQALILRDRPTINVKVVPAGKFSIFLFVKW